MSRAVAAVATIGGRRYDTHAAAVRAVLTVLPAPSRALVVLPAGAGTPQPGDDAVVELDGGDGLTTVLTGTVAAVRRDDASVVVTVGDAGVALAAARPGSTADRQDAGAVVRTLAAAAGVDVADLDLDLGLACYVAGQRRTAAEHVALLARLGGCLARVDADGRLSLVARPAGPPDVALRWGREIAAYRVSGRPAGPRQVPVGSGPSGSADGPTALQPSTSALRGDASGPSADLVLDPTPLLRAPSTVRTAGSAAEDTRAGATRRLRATCFLLPDLRPGVVVQVADTPDGLDAGPWLLDRVTHEVGRDGGRTQLEADLAGPAGPGGSGLLVAAASAVGSLL